MTPSDRLQDLRAKAEAATPGPWETHFESDWVAYDDPDIYTSISSLSQPPHLRMLASAKFATDAAHIAAWSPNVALRALDVIEAAAELAEEASPARLISCEVCGVSYGHMEDCPLAATRAALSAFHAALESSNG